MAWAELRAMELAFLLGLSADVPQVVARDCVDDVGKCGAAFPEEDLR